MKYFFPFKKQWKRKASDFFLTFVNRPTPFTYIPPTGNERGRKPIAMYCNRTKFRTRFNFVYFVLLAGSTKFSSLRKPYTYSLSLSVSLVVRFCESLSDLPSDLRFLSLFFFFSCLFLNRFPIYFPIVKKKKFEAQKKKYTYTSVSVTTVAARKFLAYESWQTLEYEIFTRTKISAITVCDCRAFSTMKRCFFTLVNVALPL